jgi:hypothetical protein
MDYIYNDDDNTILFNVYSQNGNLKIIETSIIYLLH